VTTPYLREADVEAAFESSFCSSKISKDHLTILVTRAEGGPAPCPAVVTTDYVREFTIHLDFASQLDVRPNCRLCRPTWICLFPRPKPIPSTTRTATADVFDPLTSGAARRLFPARNGGGVAMNRGEELALDRVEVGAVTSRGWASGTETTRSMCPGTPWFGPPVITTTRSAKYTASSTLCVTSITVGSSSSKRGEARPASLAA